MNNRDLFLKFVREGGKPICSPQIGGGAGFDTKLAGKEWISETTLDDTLAAVGQFDMVPLLTLGPGDPADGNPSLQWKEVVHVKTEDAIHRQAVLETPKGTLRKISEEKKYSGDCPTRYPVTEPAELDILEYYVEELIRCDFSAVTESVRQQVRKIAGRAALCSQWPVQPYELLCFPNGVDTIILAEECPDQFKRIMEKIVRLNERMIDAVAVGGADFIFLGAPGYELISPRYYQEFIVPYSRRVTEMAHRHGLLVYSHMCTKIEPFLTMGVYNRMGIDLFETLSPPPVGNIVSLADALSKIEPSICTRGNLGLDVLLNATPQEVQSKTREILAAARGRKHIVAASDYLFYQIPRENVQAMIDAVNEFV